MKQNDSGAVTLKNDQIECRILPMGAALSSVRVQDRGGVFAEVALALAADPDYEANNICTGATLGPAAGRIRGGELRLEDQCFQLVRNDGANTLHGGPHGLSAARFQVTAHTDSAVTLRALLADGLDGWPGNRTVDVTYTLGPEARITIDYQAESDRDTYLDLSNHSYWNLSGRPGSDGLGQQLQIAADEVLYNNEQHLPVKKMPVAGTPFDFRQPQTLEDQMNRYPQDPQLKNAHGYNNAFVLRKRNAEQDPAAVLYDPASGRRLKLFTDQPALVVYSGGYLDASVSLCKGAKAAPGCAVALEAQNWPDAGHLEEAPHPVLKAGGCYRRRITFCFETDRQ